MKTASKYERGDRVVSIASWNRRTAGTVSRAGRGVSVMVRWDGGNNDERVFLNNIRIETPDDVAKREHEAALRAWRDRRPQTTVARVDLDGRWGRGGNDEIGATAVTRTPAEMRTAAEELRALADWFEARPAMAGIEQGGKER